MGARSATLAAMLTAMKAAMKAAMKKAMKKTSKIASGKMRKALVLRGSKEKTSGGLTAAGIMKNKYGKCVSKAASASRKKAYIGSKFHKWITSVAKARAELKLTGFVGVGGKTATGKALYTRAKAIYSK